MPRRPLRASNNLELGVQMDRAGGMRERGSAADAALGRAFAEIAPNASFVIYQFRVHPDGTYEFPIVSSGFQDLFGIRPGNVAESGAAFSRVHPDDRKTLLDGILEVHRTLAPWHGEFRVLSPRGQVWVEGRSAGRRESDGSTLWFGVLFDVTGRRQAQQALREREAKYRAAEAQLRQITETVPLSIAYVDTNFHYRWVNGRYEELFGVRLADAQGRHVREVLGEEFWRKGAPHFARVLTGEAQQFEAEIPRGSNRWFALSQTPERDASGRVTGYVAMAADITAERQAVALLRESEERYRALVENSSDFIWEVDGNLRFTYASPRLAHILGYSLEEVQGKTPLDLMAPEEAARVGATLTSLASANEPIVALENAYVHKGGRSVVLETSGTPVLGPGGELLGYRGVCRDVTQRIQLQEQLRQSQKMEAVGQLAGGVAHDFNNLLTVISGNSEFLLSEDPSPANVQTFVGEIQQAADRAAGLTRQLLAFSRRQILKAMPVDLNEIVAGSEKLLRRLLGEDIVFVTILDRKLGRVLADASQMEQVLLNLAVNARDAMPTGGRLTIETRDLRLGAAACGVFQTCTAETGCHDTRRAQLVVADTGCGMSSEVRSRAFEPFFTTKSAGKGTGLGLATVYGIVGQSGGEISLESAPSAGTTMRICLPALEREAAARTEEAAFPTGGRETVLAVEDEEAVRRIVCFTLESQGYTVLEARNGQEALDLAGMHDGPIDLLVSDVVMPSMSGPDLARILRARRPETRVLFVSGYTDDAVLRHGIAVGEDQLLQKPFSPLSLLRIVRETLDRGAGGPGTTSA